MSYKLTLVHEGRTLDRHEFPNSQRIVIGRHEDCDVIVDVPGTSRQHCEIEFKDDAHVLHDLGSSNGTFVSGKRIKNHALNTGDVFSIVGVNVKYEAQLPQVVAVAPVHSVGLPDLTMQVNPKALRDMTAAAAGSRPAQIQGYLVVYEKGGKERQVLLRQNVYRIGKANSADLQLAGAFSPRLAALLVRDDDEFWLLDVSPKGTWVTVNDQRVRVHALEHRDMVEIGGKARFQFHRGLPKLEGEAKTYLSTRRVPRPGRDS